ncbi:hypothetical protein WCLP8_2960001 [uncultured Gammaproteobacteria bacterium]
MDNDAVQFLGAGRSLITRAVIGSLPTDAIITDGALVGAGPGGETRLLVTVPITRLEEWLEVRKRLGFLILQVGPGTGFCQIPTFSFPGMR